MRIEDLNREQLIELKERYYTEKNENVSYGELADVDNLVTDEEVINEYGHLMFTNDDFFCSCGKPEKDTNESESENVYVVVQTGITDYCENMPMIHCVSKDYMKAKAKMKKIVKELEIDIANDVDSENIEIDKDLKNDKFEAWYKDDTNFYSVNVYILKEKMK